MKCFGRIVIVLFAICTSGSAQEPVPLGKGIDLGSLAEHFTLLSAEASWGVTGNGGYTVVLKLQAKKDVDTAGLYFQVGAFDKGKLLLEAKPLKFDEDFPLLKGECMYATCTFTRMSYQEDGLPWSKIYIRAAKKPSS
jgi:hypothetical protein